MPPDLKLREIEHHGHERAGHFPQVDEPHRFIEVLTEFIDSTEAAEVAPERWREMLQRGEPVARA